MTIASYPLPATSHLQIHLPIAILCPMLTPESLYINKLVQGEYGTVAAGRWFEKFNPVQQREIVLLVRQHLEQSNPGQEGVDYIIDRGYLNWTPTQSDFFREHPYDLAIVKASEVPDEELDVSFNALITLYRHFDKQQRNTICKGGCDHEWHNLYWEIRTDNVMKVVYFYSSLGLDLEHHKHGNSFHYSVQNGQSVLKIYAFTQLKKNKGLGLRINLGLTDFDNVMSSLQQKGVIFSTEPTTTETGKMAVVMDPDGRKVRVYCDESAR